jgi:hypothetical protein
MEVPLGNTGESEMDGVGKNGFETIAFERMKGLL